MCKIVQIYTEATMVRRLAGALGFLILSLPQLHAGNITYTVNQTIGGTSVTGFFETDGTIGLLTSSNFLDWNLVLTNGANTFDMLGPLEIGFNSNGVAIGGTGNVSATPTQLLFNFEAASPGFLFMSASNSYWCLASAGANSNYCDFVATTSPGEDVRINNTLSGSLTNPSSDVIGTVGSDPTPAPEPSTFALMLIVIGFPVVIRQRIGHRLPRPFDMRR